MPYSESAIFRTHQGEQACRLFAFFIALGRGCIGAALHYTTSRIKARISLTASRYFSAEGLIIRVSA